MEPPHALKRNTHMIHLIHDRVVRLLVDGLVRTGLALALALVVSRLRRAAHVRRDFCAGRAEGRCVVLYFFEELGFGFEVVWQGGG
jgi:hypothetical protein